MRYLLASAAIAALMATTPAFAQNNDMRAMMNKLDQMQRQMDTMSRQLYKGEAPPEGAMSSSGNTDNAALAAQMDERMSSLEGSLKQINNRLDEQDYAVGQMKQQFELYKSDMEVRLKDLSASATALPPVTSSATPAAAIAPAAVTPSSDPDLAPTAAATPAPAAGAMQDLPTDNAASLYDAAFQALREQKYERAEAGFKEFMQRYPTDTLAGNAQYWLGESFYVRGNYADAAKSFATGYQKYPKSSKAADNLLKLGLSLSQTGKTQEACVTLTQLDKQFPSAAAVIKQRAVDEQKKLSCTAPGTNG